MQKPKVAVPRGGHSWFQTRNGIWLAMFGSLLCILANFSAAAQSNAKNVLVLYSYFNRGPSAWLDSIESATRAHVPGKVNFYVSYPETELFDDQAYQESQAETLRREYERVKLDLVIVVSDPALQFAVKYRDKVFPGAPLVVTGISSEELAGQKWPGVTGVASHIGIEETIDLAIHLDLDTKTVAVISNDTGLDWAIAHSELLRHRGNVGEIDIIGLPDSQMLQKVAALPPHTVALFQVFRSESTQPAVGVYDVLDATARRLPTYSAWPNLALDHGGVGGAYRDLEQEIQSTGEIAARVLSGEQPDNIPVVNLSHLQVKVDWREIQKWHIPVSTLPAGSVILDRPPTIWERDRKYIVIALVVIAAQMLLIIGLLWQRARKRKAEAVLRESEERFRVMADTTPSLIWMCDARGKITYLNERRIAFTGPDPDARYGEIWIAHVHPDDVKNMLDTLYKALETQQAFSQEYRLRRSDGVYRWMLDVASPRVNGDGSFAGFIGSAIDTTDQKLAQKALEKVSGQLIEAQEKERSRIARDLHDDICQRLALLSMELEQANRNSAESPSAANANLEEIRKHCSDISTHVHLLSHQLHSSKLDYLGVVAAVRGMCNETSEQHQVRIVFSDKSVPARLPRDISLCLFRVAQEAVHNAVKYSGADEFVVEIVGLENEIQLVVQDAGSGFDVEEAKKTPGLGLVSMQERMNLVHGRLSVESKPGKGTKIIALVPLSVAGGDSEAPNLTQVA